MIKWTTPTLTCNIPEGIEYEYILLTLMQGSTVIEKQIDKNQIVSNQFSVFFTQDDTSKLQPARIVEAQLNIINGGTRLATNIIQLQATKNLHDSYIEV